MNSSVHHATSNTVFLVILFVLCISTLPRRFVFFFFASHILCSYSRLLLYHLLPLLPRLVFHRNAEKSRDLTVNYSVLLSFKLKITSGIILIRRCRFFRRAINCHYSRNFEWEICFSRNYEIRLFRFKSLCFFFPNIFQVEFLID